jgi:hypothetical protein
MHGGGQNAPVNGSADTNSSLPHVFQTVGALFPPLHASVCLRCSPAQLRQFDAVPSGTSTVRTNASWRIRSDHSPALIHACLLC